jgi:hypothetical protein
MPKNTNRDPKVEDNVLDKAYHLFGANFFHRPSFDPLGELVDHAKWVKPPHAFLKGTKRSRIQTTKAM